MGWFRVATEFWVAGFWCRDSDPASWVGFVLRHDFFVVTATLQCEAEVYRDKVFSIATGLALSASQHSLLV